MVGRVVSTKMQKTVSVLIEREKKHAFYGKAFIRTKKYLADDPIGAKMGDIVVIEKIRPISKRKHWKVIKVLGQDIVSLEQAELKMEAMEAISEVMPEEKVEESSDVSLQSSVEKQESQEPKKEISELKKPKKTRAKKEGKGGTA